MMGALAVVIDWGRPVAEQELDAMLAPIPHLATGGIARATSDHAALAETRFPHETTSRPTATVSGNLAIVGDLRLWNLAGLRSRAGGQSASAGMGERRLLLEAYRRTGIGFLEDVDGDFAFVIWDNEKRELLAVRDRFGVGRLFFERTPTGIRFGSEVKQLVRSADRPIEPSTRLIAEFSMGRYEEAHSTFFEGVNRVRPSMALLANDSGERAIQYWNPRPEPVPSPSSSKVTDDFREHLIEAVRSRVATSDTAVSQLSGGLDSSSIAESARLLFDRDQLSAPFHTVSAIFPGYDADESPWIQEIVSGQPFPHHDFVPDTETIAQFEADMWDSDTPRATRIGNLWTGTGDIASQVGADLVLTGIGGDDVLDQGRLLPDLLRTGSLGRWFKGVQNRASWADESAKQVMTRSIQGAVPPKIRNAIRPLLGRSSPPPQTLLQPDIWDRATPATTATVYDGFPDLTQNWVIEYTRTPVFVMSVEYNAARFAHQSLASSHPYLDRQLVEYIASIPAVARPLDGRTKPLVRDGFSGFLPDSVLERRLKTVADQYHDVVFARQSPHLVARYPSTTASAEPYLDRAKYSAALKAVGADGLDHEGKEALWAAWMLMTWLDGLDRY